MKDLKGTETEKNLLKAFAGESQARNRYTYFASKAKKEGFVQMQAVFEETASQEKEHAKRLFKFLKSGEELEITAAFPAGNIGSTVDNLAASAEGENSKHISLSTFRISGYFLLFLKNDLISNFVLPPFSIT